MLLLWSIYGYELSLMKCYGYICFLPGTDMSITVVVILRRIVYRICTTALTECAPCSPFNNVTVSRRPKRATSAAVLGVLLTSTCLGGKWVYSHSHGLSLHARPWVSCPLILVSNEFFVTALSNIIYPLSMARATYVIAYVRGFLTATRR